MNQNNEKQNCHKPTDKEFPLGKEKYCPRCYFKDEKVILREDCPHNLTPKVSEWREQVADIVDKYPNGCQHEKKECLYHILEPIISKVEKEATQRGREIEKAEWETKTIVVPKGSTHPVHDRCDDCFQAGLNWNHPEVRKAEIEKAKSEGRDKVLKEIKGCPPHELIDYHQSGTWSSSMPPPNKICSKCLMTILI